MKMEIIRKEAQQAFERHKTPDFIYGLNMKLDVETDLDDISSKKFIFPQKELDSRYASGFADTPERIRKKAFTLIEPSDKFSALHQSKLSDITFITVPDGEDAGVVEIRCTAEENSADHLVIVAGKSSRVSVVENLKGDASFMSKTVEIFADDNSRVDYACVQTLGLDTIHHTVKRGSAGRDATINWLDCCFGSKLALTEVSSYLDGEGSTTNNHGVFLGRKDQQYDILVNSYHRAPNTYSDIVSKGALSGSSKGLYRGLVKIYDNAANSNGYQKEDTLLLSKDAVADSIPNLEIDNNDVKCSHGATIGRIDKEKLFYLMSRGLPRDLATHEYVKGFFDSLVKKLPIESMADRMHDLIDEALRWT